jgi:hypothetical protein
MSQNNLPRDRKENPIQVMGLSDAGHHIAIDTENAAKNVTPFDPETRVISVYSTVPIYARQGDAAAAASATNAFLPAGVWLDFSIGDGEMSEHKPFFSALSVEGEGILHIAERA